MIAIEKLSYVDPNGYVFRTEQGLFRAIRPGVERFYPGLLHTGTVARLTAAADPAYLTAMFAEVEARDESVFTYAKEILCLGENEIRALRDALLK